MGVTEVKNMDVLDETTKKMQAAVDHLKQELRALRTGRAHPSMVESVMVEVYGTRMRLQDLATISVPEPRQLLISPFDAGNIHSIARGLDAANLNIPYFIDGNVIRMKTPEMTTETRQKMVKEAKKKCEDTKVQIRTVRRDANQKVEKQEADGDISEDQKKRSEKKIQELTDKFCKLADQVAQDKEKEILTI